MMKAVRPALHDGAGMLVLAIGLLLNLSARGAVSFTISPAVCSNTYAGSITMQITGLTNGETVLVRKFLDINTNRVIDTADWLVQSLNLTDGQNFVIAGVTNFNVPGDSNSATGAITASVSFPGGGFAQQIAGTYSFKFSSPSGRFTAITNFLTVTNLPYPQSFTGTVKSGGTNVPYAGVVAFTPPTPNGGINPVAGTIANSLGGYTLKVPTGTYMLWAVHSNYVADFSSAPVLTLGAGATITTNLTLIPATRIISGRLVDAATNSIGIPGISLFFQSTNNLIASGFSDSSGNFVVTTTSSLWKSGGDSNPLDLHGYLALQNEVYFDTTTGNVTSATIALPRATSFIYGTVKDDQNRPFATLRLNGQQNNGSGPYRGDAVTDPNGNYVMSVVSGTWSVSASGDSPSTANYIFSEPPSTNITNGVAVHLNLTGILATNHISGYVRDNHNNAITNVGVFAQATISGLSFNASSRTDTNGNYSFNVANGAWNIGVNCGGGSDSLNQLGYLCVTNQTVTISNNNGTANFIAPIVSAHVAGFVRDTGSNAVVNVGVYAHDPTGTYADANASTDGTGHYSLGVIDGTWNVGVSCYGGNGSLSQLGFLCVNEQSVTVSNNTGTADFTVLAAPHQISGYVHSTSAQPITNVNVNANATISGTPYNVNGQTDGTGFYSLNVASGTWDVNVNCNGGPANSLSSLGYLCVNSQSVTITNTNGVANFTAQPAPYQITGYLRDTGAHPITNINVNAGADIGGTMYFVDGLTDTNGFYSLNVANGTWNVNVNCSGGSPGNDLGSRGYLCVNNQSVTISNANGNANFTAQPASWHIIGYLWDSGGRPLTNVNVNASATLGGTMYFVGSFTDTNGYYTLHVANGIWNVNVDCNALGKLGLLCPNSQLVNISNNNGVLNFVAPAAPYQIAGYLSDTLAHPITNIAIYANANLNGTNYNANGMTDTAGHYVVHVINGSWSVGVGCNGFNGLNQAGYLCVNSQTVGITNNNGVANFTAPFAPYHISGYVRDTTNRPVANLNVFANSGPYYANAMTDNNGFYSMNVANGSWNVGLDCNGLTSQGYGCPSSQVTNIFNADAVLNFTVAPGLNNFRPTITGLVWLGNNQFRFTFNTVTGINYTVQYSTNFSTWYSWLTLSGSGAPITVTDPSAAPRARVYRVQLTP
jgi:hypothetical protein